MSFDGEAKNFFHNIYNAIPANKRKDFINRLMELNNVNTEASNIKTSDFKNRDIPIVLEADVVINNQVTLVNKQCYAGIDFFPGTFSNYVPDAERESPIDMDHVFMAVDEVTLELPANAKPVSLPSDNPRARRSRRQPPAPGANMKASTSSPVLFDRHSASTIHVSPLGNPGRAGPPGGEFSKAQFAHCTSEPFPR